MKSDSVACREKFVHRFRNYFNSECVKATFLIAADEMMKYLSEFQFSGFFVTQMASK